MEVGGVVGGVVGNAVSGAMDAAQQPAASPTASAQQPAPAADEMAAFKAKIDKLMLMKDAGMIDEEEFGRMKAELLKSIM